MASRLQTVSEPDSPDGCSSGEHSSILSPPDFALFTIAADGGVGPLSIAVGYHLDNCKVQSVSSDPYVGWIYLYRKSEYGGCGYWAAYMDSEHTEYAWTIPHGSYVVSRSLPPYSMPDPHFVSHCRATNGTLNVEPGSGEGG